ncbi:hypothetical protein BKA83DRAFT_4164165 [Pisolithus microcarpus]|nr:hypothetical protein BKA83DRAFT_4164165 [Pisolithus microcarpus]
MDGVNAATENAPESVEELHEILQNDTKVKIAVDGVLRGKYMDKFLSAASAGFGFCSVYSQELAISNRKNGYRDVLAKIDLSTYRRIPWDSYTPFFLVSFFDPVTLKPLHADPRSLLRTTCELAAVQGFSCMAGVEYEYFNFKETPESVAEKQFTHLSPLTPGMHGYSLLRTQLNQDYFNELFDESLKFRIDVEGHRTRVPGVLETALAYTYALRMADNASIGMKHQVLPSFMAKPWGNVLLTASRHTHVSLRDPSGQNLFAYTESSDGRDDAAFEDTKFLSSIGEQFLAGILDGLPEACNSLPCLCLHEFVPTINGYKRLVGGESFWAPNAPASIRIISPPAVPPSATRFEVRVPGADMNPYLVLSAIFRLGMRGITQGLKLTIPPISTYLNDPSRQGEVVMLPTSLEDATTKMMRSGSVAREVFGDEFSRSLRLWNAAVTNWEVERYLELA